MSIYLFPDVQEDDYDDDFESAKYVNYNYVSMYMCVCVRARK